MRKNPKAYLKPLNLVTKGKRPLSAKYRQKYQSIEMISEEEQQKGVKNHIGGAKINKAKSNFFDIQSSRKFGNKEKKININVNEIDDLEAVSK